MRTLAAGIALAIAAAVPAAASAAPASPMAPMPSAAGARMDEAAFASWMFPTGEPNRADWIFGGGFRDAGAGGRVLTFGFVVKGTCRLVETRRGEATTCRGQGSGGLVDEDDFVVDPVLQTGRLVIDEPKGNHSLEWRAVTDAPPYGYVSSETCPGGDGDGAGFLRTATATGEAFGRSLGASGFELAILSRGAMLTECDQPASQRTLRRAAAGKTIRVVYR